MRGPIAAEAPARYVPIADYGVIGEGRSVALVSREGSIDWWSPGRYDAPSLFAGILDRSRGGRWSLGAVGAGTSAHRYLPDTNVLEREHATARGRVLVRDHMPFEEDAGADAVLVRRIVGVEGAVEMQSEFAPRFQYARVYPRFSLAPRGLLASGGGEVVHLDAPVAWTRSARGTRRATFTVRAGDELTFVLRHAPFASPVPLSASSPLPGAYLEQATIERWQAWSQATVASGPDEALVRRSALALQLLQFRRNGAFVAAGTTSLPEAIGGVRNWDYRFTWLRDGVFTARALHDVGQAASSRAFTGWLTATLGRDAADLRIMYTLSGSSELPERELPHLEGYRQSSPVRVGNGAAHQRQLDVYGEVIEHLFATHRSGEGAATFPLVRSIADWIVDHWREPDQGIWEMRAAPRHFILSKAMAWAGLDRAERFADVMGEAAPPAWRREADAIRAEVLERGFDQTKRAFVQAYDHPFLDASNLLLPIVGFIDASDPRMVATVDRTIEELTIDGLVYRYLNDDGIVGGESPFIYCSFWLVEVLAMQGRVREARTVFDRLAARATPLGLYAEEIDAATGEHLGNFPQAFPHAGLIQAARALERAEGASTR